MLPLEKNEQTLKILQLLKKQGAPQRPDAIGTVPLLGMDGDEQQVPDRDDRDPNFPIFPQDQEQTPDQDSGALSGKKKIDKKKMMMRAP